MCTKKRMIGKKMYRKWVSNSHELEFGNSKMTIKSNKSFI